MHSVLRDEGASVFRGPDSDNGDQAPILPPRPQGRGRGRRGRPAGPGTERKMCRCLAPKQSGEHLACTEGDEVDKAPPELATESARIRLGNKGAVLAA